MNKFFGILLLLICLFVKESVFAQQDPQYTQYMYNTQVINPGYVGTRDVFSFGGLYRAQWVGLDGAPKTVTLTGHGPIGYSNVGLGLSIVRDEIGPSLQTFMTVDFSYKLQVSDESHISFGIKGGGSLLDIDFTKLNIYDPGDAFERNIDNRFSPQIGAGAYFYTEKLYVGLSVPNFLETEYFETGSIENETSSSVYRERMHYYFMAGYLHELSSEVIFKPALLTKAVAGAPLQVDISANFLFFDKLTLGASYRLSAAVSGLVGFQLSDSMFLGFAFDTDTTLIRAYNKGSYEFFMRYEIFKPRERIYTPRFF
jgi:type IX secretion system PorP/SprF family membrane protein